MKRSRQVRGSVEPDSEWVDWREADMRVAQPRTGRRLLRLLTWATALTGFVVLLMEVQRDADRCHQNCFDGSDNTFEAGHVWTAYAGSWQWDAQLALGWFACLLGLFALYASGRWGRWQTALSLGGAIVLIVGWIVWITVQPPAGRLA